MARTYEELRAEVMRLQKAEQLPCRPDDEQMADWAYGNTVIENEDITMEMAERAVAKRKQ